MPFVGEGHIWLILVMVGVLIAFGPGRLSEVGSSLGRSIREFRQALNPEEPSQAQGAPPGPDRNSSAPDQGPESESKRDLP